MPSKWRGWLPLAISLVAMLPALLALLLIDSGNHLDPLMLLIVKPLWLISLVLGLGAIVTLLISARQKRLPWTDMQKLALAANILFWCLFGASLVAFKSRGG